MLIDIYEHAIDVPGVVIEKIAMASYKDARPDVISIVVHFVQIAGMNQELGLTFERYLFMALMSSKDEAWEYSQETLARSCWHVARLARSKRDARLSTTHIDVMAGM